ncbi:MAG: hypothetical protein ABIR04_07415 [Cypionkella sp.]
MDVGGLIGLTLLCLAIAACVPASGLDASPVGTTPAEQDLSPDPRPLPPRPLPPSPLAPSGQRERSPAFDQALAARSSAALIMFLIHHRDDPALASVRDVLAHRKRPDSPAVLAATAGAEADVVGAFDAARLAGTASARQAFLARYPDHILAHEVAFFMPD